MNIGSQRTNVITQIYWIIILNGVTVSCSTSRNLLSAGHSLWCGAKATVNSEIMMATNITRERMQFITDLNWYDSQDFSNRIFIWRHHEAFHLRLWRSISRLSWQLMVLVNQLFPDMFSGGTGVGWHVVINIIIVTLLWLSRRTIRWKANMFCDGLFLFFYPLLTPSSVTTGVEHQIHFMTFAR